MRNPGTIADIQTMLEQTIKKVLGVTVEFTNTSVGRWTVSGEPASVLSTVKYLENAKLMWQESYHYNEELCEGYAYLVAVDIMKRGGDRAANPVL